MDNSYKPILRECGYDPSGDLMEAQYSKDGKSNDVYLPTKDRLYWFVMYCIKNNIKYSIDESQYELIPGIGGGFLVATAGITMGDQVFRSTAGITLMKDDGTESCREAREYNRYALQTVETMAKGRCLANAGFGTGMTGKVFEDGEAVPPDSGIPGPRSSDSQPDDDIPFICSDSSIPNVRPARSYAAEASPRPDMNAVRSYIVPVGGHKGEPLYQVYATDRKTVEWYASDEFDAAGRFPEFKKMVKTYLENIPA